jgi:glycosyltransferase involved in cell wall biosynthesis
MSVMPQQPVSVIVTVRNEADTIDLLLDTLGTQSRPPDEVVVVDGGSTDGTWDILERRAHADSSMVALSKPGANISEGRNAAIGAAAGPVIASTDAGVRLQPDWLEQLTAPLAAGARFVAGFFVSDPTGAFETALGATTLPNENDIDPDRFLPSSRSVAFLKADWRASGGYPEWLDFGEDLVYDMRLEAVAGRPAFAPGAVARFRPRRTLRAFVRQYYLYARGDGKADLWVWRHVIRYVVYFALLPLVVSLAWIVHPMLWLALPIGLGAMVRRPYGRLVGQWSRLSTGGKLAALVWVPIIRVAGDVAKMVGYPAGLRWRTRNRPPDWRPDESVGRR